MDNFEKIDSLGKVIDILRNFTGQNPYIQGLKRAVLSNGNTSHLTDFAMEYVLSNADYPQRQICKTVEITDWYGEVLKKNFSIEFVPKKIHIFSILGETKAFYHIVFKYRQNMELLKSYRKHQRTHRQSKWKIISTYWINSNGHLKSTDR